MALPKFAGRSVSPRPDHGIIILRKTVQNNRPDIKADVGRFKGLGEMMPAQLKETAMDPAKRSMLRVVLLADDRAGTADSVERLMGTKAEARFAFISDKAEFASKDLLDV
jgi:DNA gyrase/topoisomerase IV subunit B